MSYKLKTWNIATQDFEGSPYIYQSKRHNISYQNLPYYFGLRTYSDLGYYISEGSEIGFTMSGWVNPYDNRLSAGINEGYDPRVLNIDGYALISYNTIGGLGDYKQTGYPDSPSYNICLSILPNTESPYMYGDDYYATPANFNNIRFGIVISNEDLFANTAPNPNTPTRLGRVYTILHDKIYTLNQWYYFIFRYSYQNGQHNYWLQINDDSFHTWNADATNPRYGPKYINNLIYNGGTGGHSVDGYRIPMVGGDINMKYADMDIADITMWKRVLTPNEIMKLYSQRFIRRSSLQIGENNKDAYGQINDLLLYLPCVSPTNSDAILHRTDKINNYFDHYMYGVPAINFLFNNGDRDPTRYLVRRNQYYSINDTPSTGPPPADNDDTNPITEDANIKSQIEISPDHLTNQ